MRAPRPVRPAAAARLVGAGVAALALGVALGARPAAASNGPMPTVIGSRGPVSLPIDGDAQTMFRMPSSIGWSPEHRIDFDVFVAWVRAEMSNSLNDFSESNYTPGASGGVVFAPGRPDWDALDEDAPAPPPSRLERFTFGFGVYPDLAGGGGTPDQIRLTTFPETIGTRKAILFLTTAAQVAWTPTDWLSLGLGLHASYCTLDIKTLVGGSNTPLEGSPTIGGVPLPGNPTYGDFLQLFASNGSTDPTTAFSGDLSTFQFSATISASFRPTDRFGLGLSYRERSWAPMPFEGEAQVNATRTFERALGGLAPPVQSLFLATLPQGGANGFISEYDAELTKLYIPRQVRMSLAFWPHDRVLLGAEVAWIEWHRAFGNQQIELSNGSNADLNFVTGSTTIDSSLNSRWRNSWIFSGYASFGVTDAVTLRASVTYGRSPFNPHTQEGAPTAGFVEWNLGLGAGWRILDPLELLLLGEYGLPNTAHTGDEATSLTAKGSKYTSTQAFVHLGVTYRF